MVRPMSRRRREYGDVAPAVWSARWTSLIATSSSPELPEASAPPWPGGSPPAELGSSSLTWAMSPGSWPSCPRPSASPPTSSTEQGNIDADRPAEEAFGPVDLFFANAGIGGGTDLATSEESWQQAFDVNVNAHRWAAKHLIDGWLARGEGYFCSTASAAGLLLQIGSAPYTLTKRAAVAFAEWLAVTYGDARAAGQLPVPAGRQHRDAAHRRRPRTRRGRHPGGAVGRRGARAGAGGRRRRRRHRRGAVPDPAPPRGARTTCAARPTTRIAGWPGCASCRLGSSGSSRRPARPLRGRPETRLGGRDYPRWP